MEKEYAQGLLDVGKLILTFAKVNRVTLHEDGKRLESDTDHTVMLSVCACAVADALYKDRLDIGKVAQFAIVHDLVETYANDTDTFNIAHEDRQEKEKREMISLVRIKEEFEKVYPWIPITIESYESLSTPEARFVKTLDKAMTKITNVLNNGAYFKNNSRSEEEVVLHFTHQLTTYKAKYGEEFPEVLVILENLMNTMLYNVYGKVY